MTATMLLLAAALFAITAAEFVVTGLERFHLAVRLVVLALAALAAAWLAGVFVSGWWIVLAVAGLWFLVRSGHPWEFAGHLTLGALLVLLTLAGDAERSWSPLLDVIDAATLPALNHVPPHDVVLAMAVFAFLSRPANAVVRVVLDRAGPNVLAEEKTLKGGRFLGPLERWMIFGFALSGQYAVLTAIIAAKGILRFPEISHDAKHGTKAEYVLIGSFVSWALALAFVPLF